MVEIKLSVFQSHETGGRTAPILIPDLETELPPWTKVCKFFVFFPTEIQIDYHLSTALSV